MPADLDETLARLGERADAIELPPPVDARRRGDRSRRRRLLAGVTACAVLAVGVMGAGTWLTRDRGTAPPAAGEVRFMKLQPVGDPVFVGIGATYGLTAVTDGRGIVGWRDGDGTLNITAMDLSTGAQAWPVLSLGVYGDWNGMIALPEGILVIGEHDDARSGPDYTMFVVDPTSGKLRWQREFDINNDDFVAHQAGIVLASAADHRTMALDWRTGAVLWSHVIPAGDVVTAGVQNAANAAAPMGYLAGAAARMTDPRFVEVLPDGDVSVYEAATGRRLAQWKIAATTGYADYLPVGDRLVWTRGSRLHVSNLDGTGAHEFDAPGEIRPGGLLPCGTDGICVMWAGRPTNVTAFDAGTGKRLWGAAVGDNNLTIPVGDRVLVRSTGGATAAALYTPDGRQLLDPADQQVWVGRVNSASLLAFGGVQTEGLNTVVGVSAADGKRMVLGEIDTRAITCAWDERSLFCPTDEGLRVWRFAL